MHFLSNINRSRLCLLCKADPLQDTRAKEKASDTGPALKEATLKSGKMSQRKKRCRVNPKGWENQHAVSRKEGISILGTEKTRTKATKRKIITLKGTVVRLA